MNRHAIFAALLAIPLAVAACSGTGGALAPASSRTSSSSSAGATQTSEGGGVTVVASWPGTTAGAMFDVKLDTHSVDLDGLDLSTAVLGNDRGETLHARSWAAPKGGHHREGALSFDGDASKFFTGAKWIELVIAGVGDTSERTFRWAIGS